MAIKNIKGLLTQAAALPAAVEAKLPEGAPKLSTMLLDATDRIPATVPDFPIELPDLPAVPELPGIPGGEAGLSRKYVTSATVTPVKVITRPTVPTLARPVPEGRREIIPSPAVGVIPEVISRRGI